ncbi:MAG: hypothetical protein KKA90_03170 [Nanoarchaeota archaeon]|nr:hypothetical protein [Nanoarchaeota archaeon]
MVTRRRTNHEEKGITPIIAIVVLLLITLSIAGVGYTFISGVVTISTNALLLTGRSCGENGAAVVYMKNLGNGVLSVPATSTRFAPPRGNLPEQASTIGLFSFEGATGTTIQDESAADNDLVSSPAVTTSSASPSPAGGEHILVDKDTEIAAADIDDFEPTSITINFWFNFDSVYQDALVPLIAKLEKNYPTYTRGYSLILSRTGNAGILTAEVKVVGGSTGKVNMQITFSDLDGWHFISMRYNENTKLLELSIDSATAGLGYYNMTSVFGMGAQPLYYDEDSQNLQIGNTFGLRSDPLILQFDELRISNAVVFTGIPATGCTGNGEQLTCGDVTINKMLGGKANPIFSKTNVPIGDVFTMTDTFGCEGGFCKYAIVYQGQPAPIEAKCT